MLVGPLGLNKPQYENALSFKTTMALKTVVNWLEMNKISNWEKLKSNKIIYDDKKPSCTNIQPPANDIKKRHIYLPQPS